MIKKSLINFPIGLEILIWLCYVAIYKYSYNLELINLPSIPNNDFPYLSICLFGIIYTAFIIPYYRLAVPKLLFRKKYTWLFILTIIYFVFVLPFVKIALAWIFAKFTVGMPENLFFAYTKSGFYLDWNMIMTDLIAFLCISFSRFSYKNEVLRHKIETDHLQLQLNLLKAQLQPHFLFNTLNSLYGMSLTNSKDTSRFILLLSQMMQYILYDCNQEEVYLQEEVNFLKGYFEIEQKKFPNAHITLKIPESIPTIKLPPLLFLPLVENSFKHGKHKVENEAKVTAELVIENGILSFIIANDCLPTNPLLIKTKHGGIGLVNIKKRLELYYPNQNQLLLKETDDSYIAELKINQL